MYTNAKNQTMLWYQCNLELITCSDCVIRITFTHTNFSKICENPNRNIGNPTSRCPCDHIQFSEPPYEPDVSGHYFCGDGKVFRSQTRSLMMKFFYKTPADHIFTLQYFSESKYFILFALFLLYNRYCAFGWALARYFGFTQHVFQFIFKLLLFSM